MRSLAWCAHKNKAGFYGRAVSISEQADRCTETVNGESEPYPPAFTVYILSHRKKKNHRAVVTHRGSPAMRLLSANRLICVVKGCTNNFPLQIVPTKVEQEESDCNADFIMHMLPRLEYAALVQMATEVIGTCIVLH